MTMMYRGIDGDVFATTCCLATDIASPVMVDAPFAYGRLRMLSVETQIHNLSTMSE